MRYVIDSSSLINLKHYYPDVFVNFWESFNALVNEGIVISVQEVFNEISERDDAIAEWAKNHEQIFLIPAPNEIALIRSIMNYHKELVKQDSFKHGKPVADPFLIAKAKAEESTVITEERYIKGAHKIPNICEKLGLRSISIYDFIKEQNWEF